MARFLRIFWPRNWSWRLLLSMMLLCGLVALAQFRWWPENPLARWNREVAEHAAVASLVLLVLLQLHWIGDRIWAAIDAREDRMRDLP